MLALIVVPTVSIALRPAIRQVLPERAASNLTNSVNCINSISRINSIIVLIALIVLILLIVLTV